MVGVLFPQLAGVGGGCSHPLPASDTTVHLRLGESAEEVDTEDTSILARGDFEEASGLRRKLGKRYGFRDVRPVADRPHISAEVLVVDTDISPLPGDMPNFIGFSAIVTGTL